MPKSLTIGLVLFAFLFPSAKAEEIPQLPVTKLEDMSLEQLYTQRQNLEKQRNQLIQMAQMAPDPNAQAQIGQMFGSLSKSLQKIETLLPGKKEEERKARERSENAKAPEALNSLLKTLAEAKSTQEVCANAKSFLSNAFTSTSHELAPDVKAIDVIAKLGDMANRASRLAELKAKASNLIDFVDDLFPDLAALHGCPDVREKLIKKLKDKDAELLVANQAAKEACSSASGLFVPSKGRQEAVPALRGVHTPNPKK